MPRSSAKRTLIPPWPMGAHIGSCGRCVGPSTAVATGTVASASTRHAGLAARMSEAEQDPISVATGDLEVLVTLEFLGQAVEGLGGTVIFEAEGDP
jgi:hypothetical protein